MQEYHQHIIPNPKYSNNHMHSQVQQSHSLNIVKQQPGRMITQLPSQAPTPPTPKKYYNTAVPFYHLGLHMPQQMKIEQFVKEWIQQIFFCNGKVETQARFRIAESINKFKLFQLASCSSIYGLIRSKIQQITHSLRSFIDLSFGLLHKQKAHLSYMLQLTLKPLKQQQQANQQSLDITHPPIAKMVVLAYKYVCGSIKEVCNLWKSIYYSIQVKDLQLSTFQKSISTSILQIFTAPTKLFSPLTILSSMSLVNKCRFICADSEGVARRLQLIKFDEEEMRKVLAQKKSKRKQGFGINPEELNDLQRHILQEIKEHLFESKRTHKEFQKRKIDIPFIQQLKKQVIQTEVEVTPQYADQQDLFDDILEQTQLEITATFQPHIRIAYEADDSSSQEDLAAFYQDSDCEKDELVLESQDIFLQYLHAKVQHQIKQADEPINLTSSTANQECSEVREVNNFGCFGTAYIPEDKTAIQLLKSARKKVQNCQAKHKHLNQLITSKLNEANINAISLKQNNLKLDKNDKLLRCQNSKRCLQEQKQKLEKYRKELQKQKKELLREIQRFMREKEKDERQLKKLHIVCHNQSKTRHFKSTCQCMQSHNKIETHSLDFHSECSQTEDLKQVLFQLEAQKQRIIGKAITNQIYKGMNKQEYQTEDTYNMNQQHNGSGKKRQKHKKKVENMLKTTNQQPKLNSSGKIQELVSQEQTQLIKTMQNFKINSSSRVYCHIEESRLQKWKQKVFKIRNSQISTKKVQKLGREVSQKGQNKDKHKKKQKR